MRMTDRTILVTDTFVRRSDLGISFELVRQVGNQFEGYTAESLAEVIAAANSIGAEFLVTRHPDLLSYQPPPTLSIVPPEAYLAMGDVEHQGEIR